MINYYNLKREKIIFCCIDEEIIYKVIDGQPDKEQIVACRDINDPSYAWYKDFNDDPIAYEKDDAVYSYENDRKICFIEKDHEQST